MSTCRWMGLEWPTYFSSTNKADKDSLMRPHRPCRCMSEKHLWSGFPTAHFTVNPHPLAKGWNCMVGALEQCRQESWTEYQGPATIPMLASSESDSAPQLVGSAPPSTAKIASGERRLEVASQVSACCRRKRKLAPMLS